MISNPRKRLARPRSALKPALVIVFGLTGIGVAFLLFGHRVERQQDLKTLSASDDDPRLTRSMLLICKNMNSRVLLGKEMTGWSRRRRLRVTAVAEKLGCIDGIPSVYRAEYYLHSINETNAHPSYVIAQHKDAIEPSITALESTDAAIKRQALHALVGLSSHFNEDQRRRILRRLSNKDRSPLMLTLRNKVGDTVTCASPSTASSTTSTGSPKPTPAKAKPMVPAIEAVSPSPVEDEKGTEDDGTFRLGEGLQLKIDGVAPKPLSLPKLGESAPVPRSGVLFQAKPKKPGK